MSMYGLDLWDDPDEFDEDGELIGTPGVDAITEAWLAGTLTDDEFDAWLDAVDPGWDDSTALTKEELNELR